MAARQGRRGQKRTGKGEITVANDKAGGIGGQAEAERLLGLLEQADRKENAVLSQFCLAMRAQLMQYQNASEKELREAFREAQKNGESGK